MFSKCPVGVVWGVSPHRQVFMLLGSSLARERNSVIHHLYFYRHLISASPLVLFYGRQVLIGAREFSEFYITDVIPSIVKIECCFVSLRNILFIKVVGTNRGHL